MARTLNQTVFAGGAIYPAGTPEADVKGNVPDKFWDGTASTSATEKSDGGGKELTVKEILEAVGDDKEKAAAALEAEKAGKGRKTLVEPLEALLADNGSDEGGSDDSGSDEGDEA